MAKGFAKALLDSVLIFFHQIGHCVLISGTKYNVVVFRKLRAIIIIYIAYRVEIAEEKANETTVCDKI